MAITPGDDGIYDLDALRAARIEKRGGGRRIRLGGEVIELVAELPVDVIEIMDGLDATSLTKVYDVLGATPDDVEKIKKARPTIEDIDALMDVWGVSLGESLASPTTSEAENTSGL